MKKTLLRFTTCIFLTAFLVCNSSTAQAGTPLFQGLEWGDTKEAIFTKLKIPQARSSSFKKDNYLYVGKVEELMADSDLYGPADVVMLTCNGKLYSILVTTKSGKDHFADIKEALASKYGPPFNLDNFFEQTLKDTDKFDKARASGAKSYQFSYKYSYIFYGSPSFRSFLDVQYRFSPKESTWITNDSLIILTTRGLLYEQLNTAKLNSDARIKDTIKRHEEAKQQKEKGKKEEAAKL